MAKIYLAVLLIIASISMILFNPVSSDNLLACGTISMSIDTLLGGLDQEEVAPCCAEHDTCYRTCDKTRAQCDCAFYGCIKRNCANRLPGSIFCHTYATKYYTLARLDGLLSYLGLQRDRNCPPTNSNNAMNEPSTDQNVSSDLRACEQNY